MGKSLSAPANPPSTRPHFPLGRVIGVSLAASLWLCLTVSALAAIVSPDRSAQTPDPGALSLPDQAPANQNTRTQADVRRLTGPLSTLRDNPDASGPRPALRSDLNASRPIRVLSPVANLLAVHRKPKATPAPSAPPAGSPSDSTGVAASPAPSPNAAASPTPAPTAAPSVAASPAFVQKYEAAMVQFLQKDFAAAKKLLDEADAIQPGQPNSVTLRNQIFKGYYEAAYTAYQHADYPAALGQLDNADGVGTNVQNQSDAYNLRGLVLSKQRNYPEAENMFHKAVQTDPGLWAAKFNYAEVPFNYRNFTVARTRFEELFSQTDPVKQPVEAELTQFKVFLTLLIEGKEDAARTFMQHFNFSGATPARYFCQSALNFYSGDVDKAQGWIDSARKEYPARKSTSFLEAFYRVGWLTDPNAPAAGAPLPPVVAAASPSPSVAPVMPPVAAPTPAVALATPPPANAGKSPALAVNSPAPTASPARPPVVLSTPAIALATPAITPAFRAVVTPPPVVLNTPAVASPTPTPILVAKASPTVAPSPSTPAVVAATPKPTASVPAVVAATPKPTPSASPVVVAVTPKPTPSATPVVVAATPKPTASVPAIVAATPRPTASVPAVAVATPRPTPSIPAIVLATPKPTASVPAVAVATPRPSPSVPAVATSAMTPRPAPVAAQTDQSASSAGDIVRTLVVVGVILYFLWVVGRILLSAMTRKPKRSAPGTMPSYKGAKASEADKVEAKR